MTTVLVTGASGFVGRTVVPLLVERGHQVHALARNPPPDEHLHWHSVDLLRPRSLEALLRDIQAEHLLHLAWEATPGTFWTSRRNLDWVSATLSLFQAFAAAGGRRAVGVGSCAEYDLTGGLCSEHSTPLKPQTLYGAAKLACSSVLDRAAPILGIDVAWARLFFLYGPGEQPSKLVASLAGALVRGAPATCRHPSLVRDYLHVADVASALVAVLDSELCGPVNVASGLPVELGTMASLLGQAAGRPDLVQLGTDSGPPEPALIAADTSRLVSELGWSASYDLDRGLRATVEWWRERLGEVAPA